jgi:hypothetical protein
MIYDALNYGSQVQQIAAEHRKQKDVRGAEFLSGFKRTDKLKPVVTLTLYWGSDTWTGPRSLYEMFDAVDKRILKFVCDYRLNLIVPQEIQDFQKFHTELGKALSFIALSEDEQRLESIRSNDDLAIISNETAHLLNTCTGAKFNLNKKGGPVSMNKGLRLLREEDKLEGKIEGRIETYLEFGLTLEQIAEKVNLPVEKIKEILDQAEQVTQI